MKNKNDDIELTPEQKKILSDIEDYQVDMASLFFFIAFILGVLGI